MAVENTKNGRVLRWREMLKGDVGRRIILAVGAAGVLLLLLSEILPQREKEQKATTAKTLVTAEYTAELEQKLTGLLSGTEGVGRCQVMITLENGVEYVYASEEKSDNDFSADGETTSKADKVESTVILVKTEKGYEGLLVTELQPTVKGAVVVCEGGGNEAVRQRVTEAVTTALNITAKRVCVVAGTPSNTN